MSNAIEQLMANVNGSTFISLETTTNVKLKGGAKNPMQGRLNKVVIGSNVMVFQNKTTNAYENMINRRLAKEGKPTTFEVGPRLWGERIQGTPFVRHNGTLYLEVIFLKAGEKHYELDGERCNPYDVQGFEGDNQDESEQGGLTNKVIIRTYKVSSIKRITINGETYDL